MSNTKNKKERVRMCPECGCELDEYDDFCPDCANKENEIFEKKILDDIKKYGLEEVMMRFGYCPE
jgi:predicted amidophosphoribosyltransferase